MRRTGYLARYDSLEARADELAGLPGAEPSPVHVAAAHVFTDLLTLGARYSTGETPSTLRIMMRMLEQSRPLLLDGLANVEASALVDFMLELRGRIDTIVHAGAGVEPADDEPVGRGVADVLPDDAQDGAMPDDMPAGLLERMHDLIDGSADDDAAGA